MIRFDQCTLARAVSTTLDSDGMKQDHSETLDRKKLRGLTEVLW
jgi:hypothetical protein